MSAIHAILRALASPTVAAALATAVVAPASAQPVIEGRREIEFERPEAWAMKYFASVNLLTGLGTPRALVPGSLELGLEGLSVPQLSESERTVGMNGFKTEDLNKLSAFARPRLRIGLPRGFSAEVSYVPPIEVEGIEPHLIGAALARPLLDRDPWRLGLRLTAQAGSIDGDFTCDRDTVAAGDDPIRNPFACEEVSRDEYQLRSASLELAGGARLGEDGRFEPHAALSVHRMDLEFQANARYSGLIDRTLLVTEGTTWAAAAGLAWSAADRWSLNSEILYSPLDVVRTSGREQNDPLLNVRAVVAYRLR